MLTADTRDFFDRAREEDFVRAGSVLSMEGSSQAGCPPRKPTREANKANEADTPDTPDTPYTPYTPYMTYKSHRTYEAKVFGNCLEFEAKAHHQSSIIK